MDSIMTEKLYFKADNVFSQHATLDSTSPIVSHTVAWINCLASLEHWLIEIQNYASLRT